MWKIDGSRRLITHQGSPLQVEISARRHNASRRMRSEKRSGARAAQASTVRRARAVPRQRVPVP